MADLDQLANQLSQLTVREAIQLARLLFEGATGAHGHHHAETVRVLLQSYGYAKINVIKVVREVTGLGLKEAKDLVEGAPSIVRDDLTPDAAEQLVRKLIEAGATARIEP